MIKSLGWMGTRRRLSLLSSLWLFPLDNKKIKHLHFFSTGYIVAHVALEGENTVGAAVFMRQVASCTQRLLGVD